MDRIAQRACRSFLAAFVGLVLTGCDAFMQTPPPEYTTRSGDVMLQFVEAESQLSAFSPGPGLHGIETTAVTTITYQGRLFTTVSLSQDVLRLRPRNRAGLFYVSVPASFPNSFQTTPGSTTRYTSAAYATDRLLGKTRQKHGEPLSQGRKNITVPLGEDATTTSVWLGPYRVEILEATPDLIRYRLSQ